MIAYDPEKITFFAKTDARGQQIPFGIKAKDRQRHMYVIGKTGMGKSTLLENMAAQDLQSGEGMAFIDPHGSAIEVLLEYVPEDRLDDVVYFAPFDMENPIAFNIMEDVGIDKRHLVVSGLMSTFKKIWVDAWSARMEYILTNALLALIEYPNTTLLSVNRMLADKKYRDKVVENIKDPAVKAYWVDEFASYTERFAAEALPAIQNKIGQFTGNPLIRNIIGQPKSSFDVRKMMDEKKILLINLSKGLVGETNADLIGSMLITKIYLAAMSRAELPPAQMKQMPNFYFYVDEFQSFANATFANILSEARKYHLNLIIAHQYVQQMEEEIRDAVFGNVGTTISFRVGPFDAEVLETVFAPEFEATDLVNLGFAQIYLSLMIDGVGSRPFSAVTLPPVQTPEKSHKHMVIKRSQQNFCKPRAEVEQAVIDSHSPDKRIEDAAESGGGNKGGFAKPSFVKKVGTEQKGPPKKHGNGASNSQNNQNKNGTNQGKPPSKTADDLKSILANMAGTTDKPKPEPEPKATNTSNNEVKKTEPTDQAKRPEQNPTKPDANHRPAERTPERQSDTRPTAHAHAPASKQSPPTTDTNNQPNNSNQNQNQNQNQNTNSNNQRPTQSAPQPTADRPRSNQPNQSSQSGRPASAHKKSPTSADDLRAVLAQMANKTNSANQVKPSIDRQSNQLTQSTTKPTTKSDAPTNPADLRNILQDMVTHKNNQTATNKPTQPNQSNHNRPNNQTSSHPQKPKANLQSALAQVVAQTNQTTKPQAAPAAPKAPTPPAQPTSTPDAKTPTSNQSAPAMVYKQSAEPSLGGIRQPAYVPHEQSSAPDINIAKKILRHSGKERPPGT